MRLKKHKEKRQIGLEENSHLHRHLFKCYLNAVLCFEDETDAHQSGE